MIYILPSNTDLVVYEWNINDLASSWALLDIFWTELQTAYSWTTLEISWIYADIIWTTWWDLQELASTLVVNELGGKKTISNNQTVQLNYKTVADCWTASWISAWDIIYWTEDWTATWLTCSQDIIVCNWTTSSWITIAACNAWATIVFSWQTFDSPTTQRDWIINSWAGWLYQWWNNADVSYWVPIIDSQTWSTTDNSTYSEAIFRYWYTDWTSNPNDNLWWDLTDSNMARKWPCDNLYHIPSTAEWVSLYSIWWTYNYESLKLPLWWSRTWNLTNIISQGEAGRYRTSSNNSSSVFGLTSPSSSAITRIFR